MQDPTHDCSQILGASSSFIKQSSVCSRTPRGWEAGRESQVSADRIHCPHRIRGAALAQAPSRAEPSPRRRLPLCRAAAAASIASIATDKVIGQGEWRSQSRVHRSGAEQSRRPRPQPQRGHAAASSLLLCPAVHTRAPPHEATQLPRRSTSSGWAWSDPQQRLGRRQQSVRETEDTTPSSPLPSSPFPLRFPDSDSAPRHHHPMIRSASA